LNVISLNLVLGTLLMTFLFPPTDAVQETPADDVAVVGRKLFDDVITDFMSKRDIPGGALAVVKDGRLVIARGYGWADVGQREPAQPTSLFRIASISKPFTGVAVMTLVQDARYRLNLDEKAFKLLDVKLPPEEQAKVDPRLWTITVRQLLHHTAGWDREKSGDPMFKPIKIARAVGVPPPAGPDAIIRYMMARPLDFDPGTRHAYSNFGYCVLGRVIEKVTGQRYADYVQRAVLQPLGIRGMRLGRSLPQDQALGEVHYYQPDDGEVPSVFSRTGTKVPYPYGGFYLEAMDSHGGWLASAVDLARFAAAMDTGKPALLRPATVKRMYERPPPPVAQGESAWYAAGWMVRPVGTEGKANCWHAGRLSGTYTLLVRRHDGLSWVVLFNQNSMDPKNLPDEEIDRLLHKAANAVKEWPGHDLFGRYR
jgi:CubicO group peptidase (beta-lactamase class C family)